MKVGKNLKTENVGKLNNIIEGWGKHLNAEDLTPQQQQRAEICAACPLKRYSRSIAIFDGGDIKEIKGMVCNECSCYLPAKIRVNSEECPKGKWNGNDNL